MDFPAPGGRGVGVAIPEGAVEAGVASPLLDVGVEGIELEADVDADADVVTSREADRPDDLRGNILGILNDGSDGDGGFAATGVLESEPGVGVAGVIAALCGWGW